MKRVIYTAVVGNYDSIKQPLSIDDSYDYILFSNDIQISKIGVWQIRSIPYFNKDNTRIARWVKTHPVELFPEYEFAVWIDSNVQIASKEIYKRFDDLFKNNILLSSFEHPLRDCIYEEPLAVFFGGADSLKKMLPMISFLKHKTYPRHNGLCETNCVFCQNRNKQISKMYNDWWDLINHYSKRDQLSFNYVAWKHRIQIELLLGRGFCSRNHEYFNYYPHSIKTDYVKDKWRNWLDENIKKKISSLYEDFVSTKCHLLELYFRFKLLKEEQKTWKSVSKNDSPSLIDYIRIKLGIKSKIKKIIRFR